MRHRSLVVTLCAVFLLLASYAMAFAQTEQAWTPKRVSSLKDTVVKKRVNFPVKFSTGEKFRMAGFFYLKVSHVRGCVYHTDRKSVIECLFQQNFGHKPLQTVVHGLTYNHRYWDSKRINGQSYSYARFMARKGFVVLALDLLGSGKSDVPDGNQLNIVESSASIAQVLVSLRSGENSLRRSFKKIILVGHSLGSILSVATLGTFPHAADALVVTGWAWTPHEALPETLIKTIIESSNPYVQLSAQSRENLFYFLPKADPAVIQFDNANLTGQTPRGIFTQGLPLLAAMARGNADDKEFIKIFSGSSQVQVPVLIQLGEWDVIAPAKLADQEADFYPNASKVKVQTLSNIGHAFNLHVNNRKSWKRVKRWLSRQGY